MPSNHLEEIFKEIKKEYKDKDGNLINFEKEFPVIKDVLIKISKNLENSYKILRFFRRGGAGLIFIVEDIRFKEDNERALKIPRPLDDQLIESVQNERNLLRQLRHRNIIRLYDLGDIELDENSQYKKYPFFIMKYIKNAVNIIDFVEKELSKITGKNREERLEKVMVTITNLLYLISKAVSYLHSKGIIHYDIKPDNILIEEDENNNPLLTDLGYAKNISLEGPESEIIIGFTSPYAHSILTDLITDKESSNRTRTKIKPDESHKICDVFALGKSILEILHSVNKKFSDIVGYNYLFMYLHLAACRMLDGENISKEDIDDMTERLRKFKQPYRFYKEEWLDLNKNDLKHISYKNIAEILFDFNKVINERYFISNIDELEFYNPERMQSNYNNPAPISDRVKNIISHPIFSRLENIKQLGFLQNIYPTATHNRKEHSIGTYRNCCLYIQSLYNDHFNPLFKQLVNERDLIALLLSALLHDLGHYPLAHELEEAIENNPYKSSFEPDAEKLSHENFTVALLNNPMIDITRRTLKEIIEKEWKIKIEDITKILNKNSDKNLKIQMLHSIIDGPIDIDKLDWIQRDSHNCFLKYGDLIDEDRLIRTLSVVIKKDKEGIRKLGIGVYESGQTAAESFAFGRYLLYQSLYWHHTARAVRSMLNEAINYAIILKDRPKVPDIIKKYAIKEAQIEWGKNFNEMKKPELINYCESKNFKYSSSNSIDTLKEVIEKELVSNYKSFYQQLSFLTNIKHNLTIKHILKLISQRSDKIGKNLIQMILKREYYKRIFTIHNGEEHDNENIYNIFKDMTRHHKKDYQRRLSEELKKRFSQNLELERHSGKVETETLSEANTNKVIEFLSDPSMKTIICDAPEENPGGEELLRLIPEPIRLRQNYETRIDIGSRISGVYNEIYRKLMKHSSKGRIFCHPHIRDPLLSLVSPDQIKRCIIDAKDL